MTTFFYVAVGGALGASLRYALHLAAHGFSAVFPWGTLAANLFGCFLAGYSIRFFPDLATGGRLFFVTGFLGALTTMSGLSLELITMLEQRRYAPAAFYWTLSVVLSVALCGLGLWLAMRSLQGQAD